ncbi:hypothetical protein KR222_011061, partial [Zaprionus bogoriensis]
SGMDLLRICFSFVIISYTVRAEYLVRVDQFSFVPDDRDCVISQSSFVEQEGNRSYLSGHLMVSRPLNEITMLASMDMMRPKFQRIRLFENKLEFCSFSANAYRSKFMRQLYNNYVSFLNTPPVCPLKANFNYTLHRAFVDDRFLPDFLPECSYLMKVEFQHKSKRLAHMLFSGHIRPLV